MSSSAQDRPKPPSGAGSGSGATSGAGAYSGSNAPSSGQNATDGQHIRGSGVGQTGSGAGGSAGAGASKAAGQTIRTATGAKAGGNPMLIVAGIAVAGAVGYMLWSRSSSSSSSGGHTNQGGPRADGNLGKDKFDTKYVEEKYKADPHNSTANARATESRLSVDTNHPRK